MYGVVYEHLYKAFNLVAKNNHFCLMTTSQLFEIYKKYLEMGGDKKDILKKLKETSGLFSL